ncbi:nuclease-related domain-containing protein [Sutcliffiella halmapala]
MTVKKARTVSLKIKKLKSAKRRLLITDPRYSKIESELSKCLAGYKGEQRLDYYLSRWTDPGQEFLVLNDLRLSNKDVYFQIDTLILFHSFYLALEAKNMNGILEFDPVFQQLIQTTKRNNVEMKEYYFDPICQVLNQKAQLQQWLKNKKLPDLPGECLVVFTNSNSFVRAISNPNMVERYVTKVIGLTQKMDMLMKRYPKEVISSKDLRKTAGALIKSNEPLQTNPLQKLNIQYEHLQKGVYCSKCERLSFKKFRSIWRCVICNSVSKDTYLNDLEDYFLLVKPTISVSELKDFLGLEHISTARRIVQSSGLEYVGRTNGRQYTLPFSL